jgi:hypothetical protein
VKPGWLARIVGEIAGTGLLFAEGDAHKKQRRLLVGTLNSKLGSKTWICIGANYRAGPFTFGNMRNLLPFFDAKATELADVIRTRMGSNEIASVECI